MMKRSVKAKAKRGATRDLIDELNEGIKALAESRHGKRTLRTHPRLDVVELKDGIELTAHNPEVARQVAIAERVISEDRDALQKLAE
jgi:hypothetical protein